MKQSQAYYKHLTDLYAANKCTPAEMKELFTYLQNSEADRALLQKIKEEFDASFSQNLIIEPEQSSVNIKAPVIPFYKTAWFRASVAACFILSFTLVYNYFSGHTKIKKELASQMIMPLQPGGNQATVTLSNGKVIVLDSNFSGNIPLTSSAIAQKQLGKIDFSKLSESNEETTLFTTVQTPPGGQFNIVLPDGSEVWLNAASSITFPLKFGGNNRKVSMTGELYFEVAKNKAKPFLVSLPKQNEVEVTGTHFNIMAYSNEAEQRTTLLEGSINLHSGRKVYPLSPGQQLLTNAAGENTIRNKVNTEQVIAWKNGLFDFDNVTLPEIMRQLERWYQTDVVFQEATATGHYIGSIRRSSSIKEVLKMLELAGEVKFKISGQNIIVMKTK